MDLDKALFQLFVKNLDISDAEKFELNKIIAERIRKIRNSNNLKISREALEAAVVYLTAKERALPIFPGEIREFYKIDRNKFNKALTIVRKKLGIKYNNSLAFLLFLAKKKFNISEKVYKEAIYLLEELKNKGYFSSANPYVEIASILYVASKRTNEELPISELCKILGISRQSINIRLKELAKYL